MAFQNIAKHTMLAKIVGKATPDHTITHLSIHTAQPNGSGSNEVTGGDPAYARQAVDDTDFAAPSGGEMTLADDVTFNGPANETASHFGAWDDTDFLGWGLISGDTQFNAEGVFILQASTKLVLDDPA